MANISALVAMARTQHEWKITSGRASGLWVSELVQSPRTTPVPAPTHPRRLRKRRVNVVVVIRIGLTRERLTHGGLKINAIQSLGSRVQPSIAAQTGDTNCSLPPTGLQP